MSAGGQTQSDLSEYALSGFSDPVIAGQEVFRSAMTALSQPGKAESLPASARKLPMFEGVYPTSLSFFLALADYDTSIWMDPAIGAGQAGKYLTFHTGAPLVESKVTATFALCAIDSEVNLEDFHIGVEEFPDQSTTVLVQVSEIKGGKPYFLEGPGIKESRAIWLPTMTDSFWDQLDRNQKLYPLGVDVLLMSPKSIIGLPRTTIAKEG